MAVAGAAKRRQEQPGERPGRLSAQRRVADAGHDARCGDDRIAVDGWPVELSDTAGLRKGAETLEEEGIGKARTTAGAADLCLWLLDASAPPVWPDHEREAVRFVVNKVDLPAVWDTASATESVQVSALTHRGLPELCAALSGWLVPDPPPPGAAIPFTEPICASIESAYDLLANGRSDEARRVLEEMGKSL